ncbi:hypothetical protein HPB48_000142 [Haemaphysalis longicornis]|uniref:Reverse transcriptase n=1 Tax=Haemaphysalis longicornis TaxID=44386 RepID=A0A9J6H6L0_HAELO|nr:hypothetical protein HPB48_000142 [Haemaphysalis longicornis]
MESAVQESIDASGIVSFQNSAGMPASSFLALLDFYLSSNVVKFEDRLVVQKEGVCIGSCIAPVVSDLFFAKCDRQIACRLEGSPIVKICRYVDDYLVVFNEVVPGDRDSIVAHVLGVFTDCAGGLKFRYELPEMCVLQFLDVRPLLGGDQPC